MTLDLDGWHCYICNKNFETLDALQAHADSEHDAESREDGRPIDFDSCDDLTDETKETEDADDFDLFFTCTGPNGQNCLYGPFTVLQQMSDKITALLADGYTDFRKPNN